MSQLANITTTNGHFGDGHDIEEVWKCQHTSTEPLSLESLPRWEPRPLVLHDAKSGKALPFSEEWGAQYWASIDGEGNVIKMISNIHKLPSKAYRNPTPRDFVSAAMTKAAEVYAGIGEVCMLSVSFSDASSQLLVTLKCPETFALASDDTDKFGTTLVLRNSYKQEGGIKVAAGAIRFVCTNGCIFGNHTSIGWNHRNAEDAVASNVEEVLGTHVEKARRYMSELEAVQMIEISYSNAKKDREWRVRRTFQDMEDRSTMAIAQLPITWHQQKLVLQEAYKMQIKKGTALTKYDLWNACTAVASHQLKESSKVQNISNSVNAIAGRRDTMGREVNKAFAKGAIVDEVLAWDNAKFASERALWIQKGWDKNRWTPVGPIFQLAKKTKRTDDDASENKSAKTETDDEAEMETEDFEQEGENLDSDDVSLSDSVIEGAAKDESDGEEEA